MMNCMHCPLFSIIMPAFNAERYIVKSITSVQKQTVTDWELIIINDCSADDTARVVTEIANKDPRIRMLNNTVNMGVAKSRNFGLEQSHGKYIAFLDSDDIWHPEKLYIQLECLKNTDAALVCSSYAIVDAEGRKLCEDYIVPEKITFSGMLRENSIGCSTVVVSADAVGKLRFEEDFFHEDYVSWLKLLKSNCKMVGVRQVLVDYLFHPDSKAGNKKNAAKKRWKIYRDYLEFSVVKSAWYFAHYALAGLKKYKKV